eukprot:TRINITY_DN21060_c0_g1_i1.p1 TRINITY_DN21060_c0_g1~~TRINITY_DN21060_c0_g1_i1.p1  ORF type:complete len:335 (+),score=59.46 TRINITY_DN21060_c0_g1_i1:25-1005(+)
MADPQLTASLVSTGTSNTVDWIPDDEVSQCPLCSRIFNPVGIRKHHCRACGRVVCKNCSGNQALVQGYGQEMQRVCDDCHKVRCHDKEGALAETEMQYRREKALLSSRLDERRKEKELFHDLLLSVRDCVAAKGATVSNRSAQNGSGSQHGAPETASFASVASGASCESLSEDAQVLESSELGELAREAQERWTEACLERKQNQENLNSACHERDLFRNELAEQRRTFQNLEQVVKRLERQKQDHDKDSVEVQQKQERCAKTIDSLEKELNGLNKRKQNLEEKLPRGNSWSNASESTGSYLSLGGAEASFFRGRQCIPRSWRTSST